MRKRFSRAVDDWSSPRTVIGPGLLPLGRPGDTIGADAQPLRLLPPPRVARHYPACRVPASSARPAQDGGAGVGGPAVHDPEGAGVPDPQGAFWARPGPPPHLREARRGAGAGARPEPLLKGLHGRGRGRGRWGWGSSGRQAWAGASRWGPPGALGVLGPDGAGRRGRGASEVRATTVPEPRLPPIPRSLEATGRPSAGSEAPAQAAGGHWRIGGPGRGRGSRRHPGVLPEARPGAWRASLWR